MGKLLVYLTIGILWGPSGFNFPVPTWMGSVLSGASLFYLIVAGLELKLRAHRSWFRQSLLIALFSFSIPFFFGFWMGEALGTGSFPSRWILATALSVSALPVIIQILRERKLLGSQTGNIVICAASLCDISAWLCFLWILPGNYSQAWAQSHVSVLMFLLAAVLSSAFKLPDQAVQSLKTCSQWVAAPLFFRNWLTNRYLAVIEHLPCFDDFCSGQCQQNTRSLSWIKAGEGPQFRKLAYCHFTKYPRSHGNHAGFNGFKGRPYRGFDVYQFGRDGCSDQRLGGTGFATYPAPTSKANRSS